MTPFIVGLDTEDDVLLIRKEARKILESGGMVITGWNSEGTSVTKFQGVKTIDLLLWCNEFLQSLDPDTYGQRISRTKAKFN